MTGVLNKSITALSENDLYTNGLIAEREKGSKANTVRKI